MVRVAGVDLPKEKTIQIALTKIFGIGRNNALVILAKAGVDSQTKVKNLSDEEVSRIQKAIETGFKVEGDLKQEIQDNIARFKRIGSYRGKRHQANLPVRGQRTRTNARTKRGKRVTIGALKKEALAKLEKTQKGEQKPTDEKS